MRISIALPSVIFVFLLAIIASADITVDALVTLKTDVLVPATSAGAIRHIQIREGELVELGQLLAVLDSTIASGEYQAALNEANIFQLQRTNDVDIRLSQKTRDVSQRELQRSVQANERYARAVSNTELERLQMMVDQATLSEEKARLDLDVANATYALKQTLVETNKAKLRLHKIVSPIQGMVVLTKAKTGEWLDIGQPLARVIQLDVLRVEANVDGVQHGDELVGKPVALTTQYKNLKQEHAGKLVFVSPEIDPVDGVVRVWAEVDNKQRTLKPGMRGTLTIPTSDK